MILCVYNFYYDGQVDVIETWYWRGRGLLTGLQSWSSQKFQLGWWSIAGSQEELERVAMMKLIEILIEIEQKKWRDGLKGLVEYCIKMLHRGYIEEEN